MTGPSLLAGEHQLKLVAGFELADALRDEYGSRAIADGLLGVGVIDIFAVLTHPQPNGALAAAPDLGGGDEEVGAGLLDGDQCP